MVTVGPRTGLLAGISRPPRFDFVRTVTSGTTVQATFDGFLRPDKVGKTANVYVVEHMAKADWLKPPSAAPHLVESSPERRSASRALPSTFLEPARRSWSTACSRPA